MSGSPAHFVYRLDVLVKKMQEIKILSFAKINLSIDVTGLTADGMHLVDMVMQQLSFHDDVIVRYVGETGKAPGEFDICVKTNRYYIPTDERNLAYKAAGLMAETYGKKIPGGRIEIEIFKRIPVAAGLAGGSGNGAAVLHALNVLWGLKLDLGKLCKAAESLGSDVPFCVMGQAKGNFNLPAKIRKHALASNCSRATGTGTELTPVSGIRKAVVIAKPAIGVSTKEVYRGIDSCAIASRPNNDALEKALTTRDWESLYKNCINVLENYTLSAYPQVETLKEEMAVTGEPKLTLMSGSGPTVFALYDDIKSAKESCGQLRRRGYEAYWTRSMK